MPKGIRYQDRDIRMLWEAGEVGFIDEALARRYFPDDASGKACPKKLRQYVQIGLMEELTLRDTTVYRLTRFGIDEVERLTGERPKRAGRGDPPKDDTLLHRLGIIRVRFALDDACRLAGLELPEWIMEYDPLPGAKATDSLPRRIILCEEFQTAAGKPVTCWADGAARLRFPTSSPWELAAYIEYDRSTMTHAQMREKFSAWEKFFAEQAHRRHWPELGQHIVRLLILCRSLERIKNISETLAESPIASQVRLATEDSLRPEALLTDPIWLDVTGELRAILKPRNADVKRTTSITNEE
jgi:hypothetical protein